MMHQLEATIVMDKAERKRLEAVMETLASAGGRGETVAEVAHDARNMVTALGLYCDLLEEPGVLAYPFTHYGSELRLVAAASRRLVEKLVAIDTIHAKATADSTPNLLTDSRNATSIIDRRRPITVQKHLATNWDPIPSAPIGSLAVELLANHNLLAALAGPAITITVDVDGGACPVWMTGEDLTRVLVNLVRNASDAMPSGGRIQLELRELPACAGALDALVLVVEDNGPGIPTETLERIFESGYSTRSKTAAAAGSWTAPHRGLGLAISRSIVESAGGRICASNRPEGGARFEIELPVRKKNVRPQS
jgi:signal transduction histidine kinase